MGGVDWLIKKVKGTNKKVKGGKKVGSGKPNSIIPGPIINMKSTLQ